MKLGYMTKYSPDEVAFAAANRFECLELYVGTDGFGIDIDAIGKKDLEEILSVCAKNGIAIATLYSKVNHLDPDPVRRKENNRYFEKLLRTARRFGTDIVATCARGDADRSPVDNLPMYREVFSRYARIAEDEGVKIALENCPHMTGYPRRIRNIGYTPEMWEAMFDAVPAQAIGLEFDPSHLYWQRIDIVRALRRFGSRVYAFHAKDAEITSSQAEECGIFGKQLPGLRDWRYRLPGWGGIDWREVFKALYDAGYGGPVLIENEDPFFTGERRSMGLLKARDFLRPFMV